MTKKKIWGNMIIKNEDRYVWFAVMSVINYIDKLLIWDTASIDKTIDIIKLLVNKYPTKIVFKEIGQVTPPQLTQAREQMLKATRGDWVLIIDGDEVWWEESIKKLTATIQEKGDNFYAIVTPIIQVIGDIFHYQEPEAGEYTLMGKKGHFNVRAINKNIPGLHIKNDYPLEGFYDQDEKLIQQLDDKLLYLDQPLLHFTHLLRSTVTDNKKRKYEIGRLFPKNFKYPEVFYLEKPHLVPSPWGKMTLGYFVRALFETPFKKIRRRLKR